MYKNIQMQRRINTWLDTKVLSQFYPHTSSIKLKWQQCYSDKYSKIKTRIVHDDIIDIATTYINKGYTPLTLIIGDQYFPGGCVQWGSGGQEESIFRRTNIMNTLVKDLYPIKDNEVIYSPNVSVFRLNESLNYDPCKSYTLDFITCPNIYDQLLSCGDYLTEKDKTLLTKKLELIYQVAYIYKYDVIILNDDMLD
jgi:hypothetical protein